MAITNSVLLGDTRGNIGKVNFTKQFGKTIIRSRIEQPLNRKTQAQTRQRDNFKAFREFYKYLQNIGLTEYIRTKKNQDKFNFLFHINRAFAVSDYSSNFVNLKLIASDFLQSPLKFDYFNFDSNKQPLEIGFEIDKKILINPSDYHVTIFYKYYDTNVSKILQTTKKTLRLPRFDKSVNIDIQPNQPLPTDQTVFFDSILIIEEKYKNKYFKSFGYRHEMKIKGKTEQELAIQLAWTIYEKTDFVFDYFSTPADDFAYFKNLNSAFSGTRATVWRHIIFDQNAPVDDYNGRYLTFRQGLNSNSDEVFFLTEHLQAPIDWLQPIAVLVTGTNKTTGENLEVADYFQFFGKSGDTEWQFSLRNMPARTDKFELEMFIGIKYLNGNLGQHRGFRMKRD